MTARQKVQVPDIGDFSDVEIVEVMVAPGDKVAVDDSLITLETDKAAMDVPTPYEGTVKELLVSVGDRVSEGSPIVVLETADAVIDEPTDPEPAAPAEPEAGKPEKPASVPSTAPVAATTTAQSLAMPPTLPPIDETSFARAHAAPSVRKFARELGVDLGQITGTGAKQRVMKADIKAFVKAILTGRGPVPAGPALPTVPEVDFAKFGAVEVKPLDRIKKIAGPRLHASWVNLPHVTQNDEADITELEGRRKAMKADAAKDGISLTPLAFIIKACVRALHEFPLFNTSLTPDAKSLVYKQYMHIGFAADTPKGLLVPVIRDADKKDLFTLARDLAELSQRAREGKLKAEEMQGGSFTISSLGGIGGTSFTPIINAPEVAILGVSRAKLTPVYHDDELVPRMILPLSLSYDHRVIDGATGVRFTTFLAEALGDVDTLLKD
jgi:pyruvate dehydrogenase E2 component (dihydrolipoamide acetyltransferase)